MKTTAVRRRDGGFTLVEVMIALAILGTTAVILLERRTEIVRDAARSKDRRALYVLASRKIGELELDKRLWAAGDERPAYASPSIATLAGRRTLLALNWSSCAGHDPETGAALWRYEWRGEFPKAAQPLAIGGDRVAISGGYSLGTDAFKVTASGAETTFAPARNPRMTRTPNIRIGSGGIVPAVPK